MKVHYSKAKRNRRSGPATTALGGPLADALSMKQDLTTTVDPAQIHNVCMMAQRNLLLKAALGKMQGDTVDCSFTIRLRYGDENIELRESEQQAIAVTWPSFVRDVLWHLQVVGLVVVGRDEALQLPRVIPLQFIRVFFYESAREERRYWAMDVRTNRRIDALVFVKHHPLSASGELTSPVASVMMYLARYERVLANQDVADYRLTHPVWTFENDRNGAGRPTPLEHDEFVEGEVQERYMSWHEHVAAETQSTMAESQRIAAQGYAAMVAKSSRSAMVPDGARLAPWTNAFFVPINQRVVNGPAPHANVHFVDELRLIETKILQALHIPPAIMETTNTVARYASEPEFAMQQWSETVRALQRDLTSLIAETYKFVSANVFAAYANAILGRVETEREEALRTVARAALDEQVGGGPERNDAGALQMPETDESLQRAARILSVPNESVIRHLRAKLSVTVEFHCRPAVKLEDLGRLHEAGLISRDVYAERVSELMGIPLSSFLVGIDAQAEDARNRKALQDIMTPPDEGGARGTKRPVS